MKSLRILLVLLLIPVVMIFQACGDGGGSSDTAGSLTMTDPASTNNNDGTFSVSTTVTYAPPPGKSAQGVVVTTTATDSFGVVTPAKATLTSGSNSVKYTFLVDQHVGSSNRVSIVSSIGDMSASVGITIPAFTPPVAALTVSAATADFVASDLANTTKTIVISGGTTPYSFSSSVPTDISVSFGTFTNELVIKLLTAAVLPGTPATATVTVTDAAAATKTIAVTYFK